mgnify:CR=1 FL=1
MISFAKFNEEWFNRFVKNTQSNIKNKIFLKDTEQETKKDIKQETQKSTDINVLLNRVKINQKNESRKKMYFSAAASAGLILFGIVIF